jgi:hypothetical protein
VRQQDSDDFVADALWACLLSFRAEGMCADERFELIRSVAARLLAGAPPARPPLARIRARLHSAQEGAWPEPGVGRWNP